MMRTSTLLLVLCSAVSASSQPGTLDATFGNGGIVQMDLMPAGDAAFDVLPKADGRLYVCGYLDDGPRDNGYVLRLLNDGTPDPDFGTVLLPSATNARATRMAFAPDSSLYLCGYADTLGYETFTVWHVSSDGTIDPDFGFGGRSSVQIGFSDARARDLAVQPDGKVVLAGYESGGFGRDGVFVRMLPDGTPDPDFSGDGILVLNRFDELDQLDALTLLADGSIVAGGYAEIDDDDQAILVKLTPDGNTDGSFDGDGVLTPSFSAESRIYAVAAVGLEIVAAGPLMLSSTSADLFITRRQAHGPANTAFGSFGVAEIDVMDDDWLDDMKILPDGRIALTGYTGSTAPGGDIDFLLACYEANGQPDTGFGNDGIVITETAPSYEGGYSVCVQPDGKLVVAGFGGVIGNSSMVVLRYANDLSTGLEAAAYNAGLLAFPNPARTQCRLRLHEPISRSEGIELLDLHGRAVRTWAGMNMAELVIDRGDLPAGIYTLRLRHSEGSKSSVRLVFE